MDVLKALLKIVLATAIALVIPVAMISIFSCICRVPWQSKTGMICISIIEAGFLAGRKKKNENENEDE